MELIIESKEAVFAVLSALSIKHADASKRLTDESRIARLIGSLSNSEVSRLATRGVVSITVKEERLKDEIDYCLKVSAREARINALITSGAPLAMMKTLGISERQFIETRRFYEVPVVHSRPRKASDDELEQVAHCWMKLEERGLTLDERYLVCQEETGMSLHKIWQGVQEFNEYQRGQG